MKNSKTEATEIGCITALAFFAFALFLLVLGFESLQNYEKIKENEKAEMQEQISIYKALSGRMSKDLNFVKTDPKYYMSAQNIDERISLLGITDAKNEIFRINVEMQNFLKNKELLSENKRNNEETKKIYQHLKNFSFNENILLEKEDFKNFDSYISRAGSFSKLLKEYYEKSEHFIFKGEKISFETEYKNWTKEQSVVYETALEKGFSIFRKKQDTALKEICVLWKNSEPLLKEDDSERKWNIIFRTKTFVFRPNDEVRSITEDKIHGFLCGLS